jgi:hypothetical protein
MGDLPLLGLSGLGVLAVVIAYLLRANAQDRQDYRRNNVAWRMRYDTEVTAHTHTQGILETERERRRVAEDLAWSSTREAAAEIAKLRAEMVQLRHTVVGGDLSEPR